MEILTDASFHLLASSADGDEGNEEKSSPSGFWSKLRNHLFTPVQLVSLLRTPSGHLYTSLRKHLKDPEWARGFVKEGGVEALLDTLKTLQGKNLDEVQLKVECGQCLRMVMDSRVGLDYIMESEDYAQKLATALDTGDVPVKKQVFELLSALCVYRTDGYTRALDTLEHYKNLKKYRYRFQFVVDEMKASEVVEYSTALVAFVNCVIISLASLNERVRIRNEFLGLKILDVLNRFRKQCKDGSNSDLAVQLDVFDEQRATDEGQLSGPDGVDLSSHMDVFFAILRQVAETPQEVPFLSILQHLLRTDLNQPQSEIIWETAETLVHRATLLESKQEADRLLRASNLGGLMRCHCSCHYRTNGVIEECDGTPIKRNRPSNLSFCSPDGTRTPGLMSPNQNMPPPTPYDTMPSPSPTYTCPDSIKSPCKEFLSKQNYNFYAKQKNVEIQDGLKTDINLIQTRTITNQASNCKNDNVSTDKSCSDDVKKTSPPSSCDNESSVNVLSNSDARKINPVNEISTPLPPPPPPPPPPMSGSMFYPPPPPPPPPVLNSKLFQPKKPQVETTLPQQNTPKPKTKMKSFNWSKIPSSKVVGKDNLWSRVAKDHSDSQNDLDFDLMEGLFCQQPATNGHVSPKSVGDYVDGNDKKKKEPQEINLLDGKRSLNINIFLKQFRSSHEDIVRILQDGAHEDLGAERLRGLLKILPESDEAEMLRNFDGDKTRLGNAEKFLLKLIDVPSYKLRIESMLLKEEFMANQEFLENSIETIRCAVQEIEECKKLHEILYMVLVAGNFLNAGGYAGNAAGFKMMSLLKLTDIRANKPSVTLIHYVAEQASKKRPDLLEYSEDVQNLEEASKISMETLKTDVSSLSQRVSKVSSQVAMAESQIKSQTQDFLSFAESKVETLQNDIHNLESLKQRLADFLCEDTDSFKLEDCFKVFHNFCSRFKAALQENERRQKQEMIAEARRKQREEQIAMKRRSLEFPDARSGNDADHIMDQLLGDIRSGFPERRLGDIYRRSKSRPEQDISGSHNDDSKHKSQVAIKRHSDPAMFTKGDFMNKSDERLNVKNRRARFFDESNGDEIIGFLQNPTENESRENRSFGSTDDFGLERLSSRRSGRRKRIDILNGDAPTRERIGSSPPPVVLAAPEETETETSSKQRLKTKINDWMLQNEKEQKRDRDLQLKLLKRQQINGQTAQINEPEDNTWKKMPEILNENNKSMEAARITRSSLSRQSENFTQKIINLLDATSNSSKSFERSKLYHSTREVGSKKHEYMTKSKDDIEIDNIKEKENEPDERKESSSQSNSDPESNQESLRNVNFGKFDRFASTRKTQRRLKLREMRIEAENANKTSPISSSEDKECLENTPSITDEKETPISEDTLNIDNKTETIPTRNNSDVPLENNNNSNPLQNQTTAVTNGETDKMDSLINRNRSTSLRSRQSRLARRINSLSTPVTSPTNEGIPSLEESIITEVPEIFNHNTNVNPPKSNRTLDDTENVFNDLGNNKKNSPNKESIPNNSKDTRTNEQINESSVKESKGENDTKIRRTPNITKNAKTNAANGINAAKGNKPNKETTKLNGHISHEVTVSTESRDFSVSKSKPSQNSKATANVPNKKSTIAPRVIKTTQNVKVQQTIQRPKNKQSVVVNGKPAKPTNIPTVDSPSVSRKVGLNSKEQKSKFLLNGVVESSRKESLSQSSSVSSVCSMSTNVKLVKDQQGQGKNVNRSSSGEKITINHNGSIRFIKEKRDSNKTAPKVISNTTVTSKGSVDKRHKTASVTKKT